MEAIGFCSMAGPASAGERVCFQRRSAGSCVDIKPLAEWILVEAEASALSVLKRMIRTGLNSFPNGFCLDGSRRRFALSP